MGSYVTGKTLLHRAVVPSRGCTSVVGCVSPPTELATRCTATACGRPRSANALNTLTHAPRALSRALLPAIWPSATPQGQETRLLADDVSPCQLAVTLQNEIIGTVKSMDGAISSCYTVSCGETIDFEYTQHIGNETSETEASRFANSPNTAFYSWWLFQMHFCNSVTQNRIALSTTLRNGSPAIAAATLSTTTWRCPFAVLVGSP